MSNVNNRTSVPQKTMFLKHMKQLFSYINKVAPGKASEDLLWNYYFTHNEPSKLEQVKDVLISLGHSSGEIYRSSNESPNEADLFWLRVEKVESHTPESLHQRNDELFQLAYDFGIDSYDGMEVGIPRNEIDGPRLITG